MCRLGMFVFKGLNKKEKAVFIANVLREMDNQGGDSQGIALLKEKNGKFEIIKILKKVGSGEKNYAKWIKTLEKEEYDAALVHNRLATNGKINIANAHPIKYKNIILIHNGVFKNYKAYLDSKEINKDITDTYAVAKLVSLLGKKVTKQIGKSGTIIYFDKKTKEIYALKTSKKPLEFFQIKYDGEKEVFGAISDVSLLEKDIIYHKPPRKVKNYVRGNVLREIEKNEEKLLVERKRISEKGKNNVFYKITPEEIIKTGG